MVNIRPAGREDCSCRSPYNRILEQLDALASDITSAADIARDAYDVANAQAGQASQYAQDARDAADDALLHAQGAQQSADDALVQATASAGSASEAADSAADALQAVEDIQADIATIIAADIGAKVDKLTTAGFYLYSHNGSSQGEVQPVVAPTAATIPIRDSNGRMQAADPASGATDKTLVTANWVSQTGDSAANNIAHRTGDETISNIKTFYQKKDPWALVGSVNTRYKWYEICNFSKGQTFQEVMLDIRSTRQPVIYKAYFNVDNDAADLNLFKLASSIVNEVKIGVYDDEMVIHIYLYTPNYGYYICEASQINGYRTLPAHKITMTRLTANALDTLPTGSVEITAVTV